MPRTQTGDTSTNIEKVAATRSPFQPFTQAFTARRAVNLGRAGTYSMLERAENCPRSPNQHIKTHLWPPGKAIDLSADFGATKNHLFLDLRHQSILGSCDPFSATPTRSLSAQLERVTSNLSCNSLFSKAVVIGSQQVGSNFLGSIYFGADLSQFSPFPVPLGQHI